MHGRRRAALLVVALTLPGCGSRDARPPAASAADARHEARALVRLAERYEAAARRVTSRTAVRLERSFDACPVVAEATGSLPSEAQLEPFQRVLYYRGLIRPYGDHVQAVGRLRLDDPQLRPAKDALGEMLRFLDGFAGAHGSECGLLRAWRASGFDRPFDIATYAGVPRAAPPATDLRAAREALAEVAARLRQLGVEPTDARRFVVASDPFR